MYIVPADQPLYLYHLHAIFQTSESESVSTCISTFCSTYTCISNFVYHTLHFNLRVKVTIYLHINLVYLPGSNCMSNLFYKYPQASYICSSSHKHAHSMIAALSIWQLVTSLVYIGYLLRGTSGHIWIIEGSSGIDVSLRSVCGVTICHDAPNETKSLQFSYFSRLPTRNFKVFEKVP